MLTAAVVIPVASFAKTVASRTVAFRKLPRKNDARNASDFFNGLRLPGVDRHFWHSCTASANSVTLLAFGGTYEMMLWVRIAAPNASGAAADRRGFIRVKFKLFSFLENARRTGDNHALQSRRRQNPGDQRARAAGAAAARVSVLGKDRGADLSHAAGDSPRPSRIGRPDARDHRPVFHARSQGGGSGVRAQARRNEKRTRAGPHRRHARLFRKTPHHRGLEGADQRSGPRRQLSDQQGAAPGAPVPPGSQRAGASRRQRISRHDLAAVLRGL